MAVKIEKRSFGKTARGENVTLFKIETPELTACVLDYGATVQALLVKDKNGKLVDVVLGHDTIEGYETHDGYLGACVGRVANRIGGAEFTLNGKTYPLAKNDGQNHLHGGLRGFDKYVWDAEVLGARAVQRNNPRERSSRCSRCKKAAYGWARDAGKYSKSTSKPT